MASSAGPYSIAVIGAGPGGLAFARAAQLAGHKVQVFEKQPELSARGGSIMLAQAGRCIEEHLGLGQELQAIGNVINSFAVQHPGGTVLQQMDGDSRRRVMRVDLVSLLAASLEPASILFGKELDSVSAADETGPLSCSFKDGTSSLFDLVVGADGINSVVRRKLFDSPPKEFTGYRMFLLLDTQGHRRKRGLPLNTSSMRFASGEDAWLMEVSCIKADGSCCDTVGIAFKSSEEVTDAWDNVAARDGFRKKVLAFTKEDDYLLDALESADVAWDWGIYQLPPLASWAALGGRVCLLGDACHATAPFLGQGANMAIQDAVCLARCLSASTSTASSLAEAVEAFEARRRQSCERIVASSKVMADLSIAAGDSRESLEQLLARLVAVNESEAIV